MSNKLLTRIFHETTPSTSTTSASSSVEGNSHYNSNDVHSRSISDANDNDNDNGTGIASISVSESSVDNRASITRNDNQVLLRRMNKMNFTKANVSMAIILSSRQTIQQCLLVVCLTH
jgi:hypothetical protein